MKHVRRALAAAKDGRSGLTRLPNHFTTGGKTDAEFAFQRCSQHLSAHALETGSH